MYPYADTSYNIIFLLTIPKGQGLRIWNIPALDGLQTFRESIYSTYSKRYRVYSNTARALGKNHTCCMGPGDPWKLVSTHASGLWFVVQLIVRHVVRPLFILHITYVKCFPPSLQTLNLLGQIGGYQCFQEDLQLSTDPIGYLGTDLKL